VSEWRAREQDPGGCLRDFAAERELDVLIVMLAFQGAAGEFRRQLVLQVRGRALYGELLGFLEERGLALRPLAEPPAEPSGAPADERRGADPRDRGEWALGVFEQGETGFSRKRLEPELRNFAQAGGKG
jgi:hypothetical protein